MIAFACRYGHQNLLGIVGGDITLEVIGKFNRAVRYWVENETKKGQLNAAAEGWG